MDLICTALVNIVEFGQVLGYGFCCKISEKSIVILHTSSGTYSDNAAGPSLLQLRVWYRVQGHEDGSIFARKLPSQIYTA